uniref:Hemolymph proteinase 9 n=1 Tax=Manduca sexta TaxID=7130 RepID=Q5MPC5_MANSE|nr:hemolymph proteinase 9 [Manduca sexta]
MKYLFSVIFFVFFCSVFTTELREEEKWKMRKWRHKRKDDRWNWGYVDITEKFGELKSTTEDPVTPAQNSTPCMPYVRPPTPDFSASGRRISEVKCYEYIWDVKIRDEMDKERLACIKYRQKHRGILKPSFAIGGRDTGPGEFPHMGAIGWKATIGTWVFKCGSSLISNKFVLTAAHCSKASSADTTIADPVPKIVRLGDKNIIDVLVNGALPKDRNIINIIVHPQYSSPKKYYDIALMELDEVVIFTKLIQPACLWSKMDTSSLGKEAILTGWGVVESGGKTISPELQAAVVDIIDTPQCEQLLSRYCNRKWCGLQEHQLCAGKLAGGVDACQGDSGGPLQVKISLPITTQGTLSHVIGVTSFGVGCALPNLPGIYTRVSSFIDWIEENVWKQ